MHAECCLRNSELKALSKLCQQQHATSRLTAWQLVLVQVTRAEFVLLWATYLAIMFTSLEAGIGIGIILATFYFAFSYARVTPPARSAALLNRLFKQSCSPWHRMCNPRDLSASLHASPDEPQLRRVPPKKIPV